MAHRSPRVRGPSGARSLMVKLTTRSPVGKAGGAERSIKPSLEVCVLLEMIRPCWDGLEGVADVVRAVARIVWRDGIDLREGRRHQRLI